MTDATGARGPALIRRWAGVAAAFVISGWLSTLAPGAGSESAGLVPVSAHVGMPSPGGGEAEPGAPAAGRSGAPRSGVGQPGGQQGARQQWVGRPAAVVDCRRSRCIALTFDDGPMRSTAGLLDILAARRAKATFFVVGRNVEADPGTVRRAAEAGHEIGNHSFTHADLGRASTAKVEAEVGRTQQAVRRATGRTPTLFRPPYGSTGGRVAAVARRLGLAQVIWSVDTQDWRDRSSRRVASRVLRGARRGAIVLMHDIHPTTVAAMPAVLRKLAAKGYLFVTVSELFGDRPPVAGREYTSG